jgi:hypothetical protein
MKSAISLGVAPCNSVDVHRRFEETYCLHLQSRRFVLLTCYACSSTLNMEALHSSVKSANFYRTSQRYTPEDCTFYNYDCDKLKANYRMIAS